MNQRITILYLLILGLSYAAAAMQTQEDILYWHTYFTLQQSLDQADSVVDAAPKTNLRALLQGENAINRGRTSWTDSLQRSIDLDNLSTLAKAQFYFNRGLIGVWAYDETALTQSLRFMDTAATFVSDSTILAAKIHMNQTFALINLGSPEALERANFLLTDLTKEQVPDCIRIIAYYQQGRIAFSQSNDLQFLAANLACNKLNAEARFWPPDHPVTIAIKNSIGMSYKATGDYSTAAIYLEDVVSYYEHQPPQSYHPKLLNLAAVYQEMGRLAKSKDLYQIILNDPTAAGDTLHFQALNNLSLINFELGEKDLALKQASRVLRNKRQLLNESSPSLQFSYLSLGDLLIQNQQFQEAITLYERLFNETALTPDQKNGYVTQALNGLGTCHQVLGHTEESKAYYEAALASTQITPFTLNDLAVADITSIQGQLEVLINLFTLDTDSTKVLAYVKYLNGLVEYGFNYQQSRKAKIAMFTLAERYIELSINRLYGLYSDQPTLNLAKDVLAQIELSKSAFFKAKLEQEAFFENSTISASLKDSLNQIERQLLAARKLINSSEEANQARQLYQSLLDRKLAIRQTVRDQIPSHQSLFNEQSFELTAIQRMLDQRDIDGLVSFYYSDEYLVSYWITPDTISIHLDSVQVSQELKDYLATYFTMPIAQDVTAYEQASYSIYQLLFKYAPSNVEQIVIIPYNQLAYLSFSSLVTFVDAKATSFRDLAYLNTSTATTQQFSINAFMHTPLLQDYQEPYVGMAPNFQGSQYPILHQASLEIQQTQALLGGTKYIGPAASHSHFLEQGIQAQVLHLATHALVDSLDPILNSRILLASHHDSILPLHAYQIYHLDIRSRLTVLSACDTGNGIIEAGEGVSSIARAFYYGGCPLILMSLWQANDVAAKDIVLAFTSQLLQGTGAGLALQASTKQFISSTFNPKFTHPYYWGNFVLIGDQSVAIDKNGIEWIWIVAISLLAILSVFVWLVVRRNSIRQPTQA